MGLRRCLLIGTLLLISACGRNNDCGRAIAYSACLLDAGAPGQPFTVLANASTPNEGCTVVADEDAGVMKLEFAPLAACTSAPGSNNPMPPLFPTVCAVPGVVGDRWSLGTTPASPIQLSDGGSALMPCR
ncbi:MAG: hypothetical protein U0228_23100 [Myxococcaceae bacterium]